MAFPFRMFNIAYPVRCYKYLVHFWCKDWKRSSFCGKLTIMKYLKD